MSNRTKASRGRLIPASRAHRRIRRPLFLAAVPAGFPSPADDYVERGLDLNEHLIRRPAATFFVRAAGDSMTGAGIHSGDLLVVDRSIPAREGSVVVAAVSGELVVKRLRRSRGRLLLAAENPDYPDVPLPESGDAEVFGVVTFSIHPLAASAGDGRPARPA